VRTTLERPDAVTASAVSARDEIGRAIAERIRETSSARELEKVAEDVLPEIEKFLESPEERRLRRVRSGIVTAFIGLGITVGGILASMHEGDLIVLVIPGIVALFIGLGLVVNGLLFTLPRKELPGSRATLDQEPLTGQSKNGLPLDTAGFPPLEIPAPAERRPVASVTEHTTKHLKEKH
jgi:hypothetical protein